MKHGQKSIQTPHFKFYAILTKGSMEPFMGYHIYWNCWFWCFQMYSMLLFSPQ
jgi:hypothetical protein